MIGILTQTLDPIFAHLFPSVPGGRPIVKDVFVGVTSGVLKLSGTTAPAKLGTVRRVRRLGAGGSATAGPVVVFLILGASKLAVVPAAVLTFHTSCNTTRPASIFVPVLVTALITALTKVVVASL